MGHVGLTPQSIHAWAASRCRGAPTPSAAQILADARALAEAGAYAIVLEAVPHTLAAEITRAVPRADHRHRRRRRLRRAGDGDARSAGLQPSWKPRFVRRYAEMGEGRRRAFAAYAADVRAGRFPADEETYRVSGFADPRWRLPPR